MRFVLLTIVVVLSGILWWLVSEIGARSRPADSIYQARLEAPCTKCGNRDVRPRYCSARCESLSPTLDIGRFEALRESLMMILSAMGEEFDPAALYDHPAENVSGAGPPPRYSPELLSRLYDAEAYAFRTFGYDINGPDGQSAQMRGSRA